MRGEGMIGEALRLFGKDNTQMYSIEPGRNLMSQSPDDSWI
ncbi:MAG: hypothetical protein OEQ53_15030 [Saprospiraceae bacterium]|nr:hypothetical protein [Saprospiraceae bacterium]